MTAGTVQDRKAILTGANYYATGQISLLVLKWHNFYIITLFDSFFISFDFLTEWMKYFFCEHDTKTYEKNQ